MPVRTHHIFGRRHEGALDEAAVRALLTDAQRHRARVAAIPFDHVVTVLGRVREAFAPGGPLHTELLDRLPGEIGFSREMCELELGGLHTALSEPFLEGKARAEWGRSDAVEAWHRRPGSPLLQRAVPRGVVLHVASGNVSTTGVLSVIEGLLARNVNVLKAASAATTLPLRFAEVLAEVDPDGGLSEALAVLVWSGEREPLHRPFLDTADAIVVWGGDEVVATYRQGLGPQGRLIAYGPKVSAALYGAEALTDEALAASAAAAARDVALWDQNACSSAQAIYLEDPTGTRAEPFAQALAAALDALADTLPMGALDLHERAEITKERELAVAREVLGQGRLYVPTRPGRLQAWTLMLDREPAFGLSPLCRTIAVKPVGDLSDAVAALAPWRAYLQTCGLAVAPARLGALSDALIGAGAHRVTRVGEMSNGAPGEPHDGVFGLGELVRWASLDAPDAAERFDGAGLVGTAEAASRSWARRRRLVEGLLPQAPRWQERLAGVQLASEADWLALPLMDRADLTAGTPPASQALLTGGEAPPHGGHWLRTGGSSGDPRLSIYGFEDYEADMVRAARGAWAAGIRPGERVANLFFTGDLYGSFLSVNRALELIGANAFSLTQTAPVESVLTCLRSFGIETVVGLSTNVQHVLAHVAEAPAGIRVRRVYYAGEPFHEAERERLRETLGVERIASIGYGGVDAGPMGYACPACVGNEHHVHDDHVFVEILDPATGRPCAPGERGEVVITSLNRRAMPLLRYRVGDLARWLPGACPCGLASPRLELLGRVEDLVRLGARRLDYGEIQAVVAARPAVASNPQLVLTGGEALTVRVEAMDASADPTGVAAAIRADLLAQVAGLGAGPLDVVVVPLGGLERVGRTGKVIRVLDRRPTP